MKDNTCAGCDTRLKGWYVEALGYRFHSKSCMNRWLAIERDRVGEPL